MTLFVYIMDHDTGEQPRCDNGIATLDGCMIMTRRKAQDGDMVIGLGGHRHRAKQGDWCIIHAMRDVFKAGLSLQSADCAYWGRSAPILPNELNFLAQAFYNADGKLCGRGHRRNFSEEQKRVVEAWFDEQEKGCQGEPFDAEAYSACIIGCDTNPHPHC